MRVVVNGRLTPPVCRNSDHESHPPLIAREQPGIECRGRNCAMVAPRNIDELKERTLAQIFALKGKGVKVSGPKINEYLSDRDLTGPLHRKIMKSAPSPGFLGEEGRGVRAGLRAAAAR